ncbi:hypothetical protein [Candidatus Nitrotoga arctica]|uniref:Uncharacterized protein n=1 Tax=Candidatus Nitrotoga arctica TaxID=453162 RepID=A0ABN8AJ77_9PROT|nr:hypothetical protein [Candidatus Nitrotoga arctica]CAG9931716.1 protein of unknown function [Candidatus Nitrotoga arctica]
MTCLGQTAITASQTPAPQTKDERYGKGLESMREILERAENKQSRDERDDDEVKQLRSTKRDLEALESEVEADFIAIGQHLKDAKLPAEIINRHKAAMKEFKTKQSELKQKLKDVEEADDVKDQTKRTDKVKELAIFMKANQHHKTHTLTDSNKLTFSPPDGKVRAPSDTEREFKTSLFKLQAIHLAGPIPMASFMKKEVFRGTLFGRSSRSWVTIGCNILCIEASVLALTALVDN